MKSLKQRKIEKEQRKQKEKRKQKNTLSILFAIFFALLGMPG